jgi:hypothetical protein
MVLGVKDSSAGVAIPLLGVAINSNSLHHLHSPLQHSPPSYLARASLPLAAID